ncbi:unnamed protein product [Cercopithifilaria johnstoni]|uniref:Uncharacterized protein n=1 Tax=Cercopithifilaria johnstoni TaxID=2874296 RepID=A0A8J2PZE6_9BILA|nr:unnamed protein product [Cercopithifilaria johnstoni]
MYSLIVIRIAESPAISEEQFRTIVPNVENFESIDEYGRNISRIQIPRSILYENAIEIKKIYEKNDDDDGDNDNDNDSDNGEERMNIL